MYQPVCKSFLDVCPSTFPDLIMKVGNIATEQNGLFCNAVWGCLVNSSTSNMQNEIHSIEYIMKFRPIMDFSYAFALAAARLFGNKAMIQFVASQMSEDQKKNC